MSSRPLTSLSTYVRTPSGSTLPLEEAEELFEQGLVYEKGGAVERAIATYHEVAELAPEAPIAARVWTRASAAHRLLCQWNEAFAAAKRAYTIAQELNDPELVAEALNAEGALYITRQQLDRAEPIFGEMLGVARQPKTRGLALQNLGTISALRGEHGVAMALYQRSSVAFREAGYDAGEAMALNNYGRALLEAGNSEEAAVSLERARMLARRVGDMDLLAIATLNHAEACFTSRDLETAEDLAAEALGFFHTAKNTLRCIDAYRLIGSIEQARGNHANAQSAYERAYACAVEIGDDTECAKIARYLSAARLLGALEPAAAQADQALTVTEDGARETVPQDRSTPPTRAHSV